MSDFAGHLAYPIKLGEVPRVVSVAHRAGETTAVLTGGGEATFRTDDLFDLWPMASIEEITSHILGKSKHMVEGLQTIINGG